MNHQSVIDIASQSIFVAVKVATPTLAAAMLMGLLVSIFQAATQINEQTLSFIPKILAMTLALVLTGSWVIQIMVEFTTGLIKSIPTVTQ